VSTAKKGHKIEVGTEVAFLVKRSGSHRPWTLMMHSAFPTASTGMMAGKGCTGLRLRHILG
jgi:hypothetical protein